MSLPDTLKALVFDPLGMTDTTCDPEAYAAVDNRAIGHQPGFPVIPVRVPMLASGGVYASAADMARFCAFHLGRGTVGGTEILRREHWDEMHRFPPGGRAYALGVADRPLAFASGPVTLYTHNGGGFGFGCCFYYCPDHQLAWVAHYNQLGPMGPAPPFDDVALLPALEATLGKRARRRPPAAPVVTPEASSLARYVGNYVAGVNFISIELDERGLSFTFPGETEPSLLAFTADDEVYIAEGRGAAQRVTFHPPRGPEPVRVEFELIDFDLNDRPTDPPGQVGDTYDTQLGGYVATQWGVPFFPAPLTKQNGYLQVGPLRLTEHLPGLLFSADGEALDLRGSVPTFRNIVLKRTD